MGIPACHPTRFPFRAVALLVAYIQRKLPYLLTGAFLFLIIKIAPTLAGGGVLVQ